MNSYYGLVLIVAFLISYLDTSLSSNESNDSNESDKPEKVKAKNLRIVNINFQSVWGKKELFHKEVLKINPNIIIGSETHIDPSIGVSEFVPPGYTAFRRDREDGWGGVVIMTKLSLFAEEVFKSKDTECIAVKIETFKKPVVIVSAYRSPETKLPYLENLSRDIKSIISKYEASPIWIGGDWNLPDIDWSTNTIVSHNYSKQINETAINMVYDCNLDQIIDFPTRKNNTLDIILTNNSSLLSDVKDFPGISDHTAIGVIEVMCHPIRQRSIKRTVHVWGRANIPLLKEDLKTACALFCAKHENGNLSIDSIWDEFKNIINETMRKIPTKTLRQRFSQPWVNRKCRRLSRRKKRLYKRARRTRLESDWLRFRNVVNECRKQCRKAHDKYINENILESTDTKHFYKYVKYKQKDNITVAPLKKNGSIIIDDQKKANILNEQYCSVFSKPNKDIPPIRSPSVEDTMPEIDINKTGVEALLNRLNTQKATGPDGISSRFLKEFSAEISSPLTLIFNLSLKSGTLPRDWLHAFVVPVYKGGNKDKNKAENYRPVSLTSICCKCLEHIVYSNIMTHLNLNNILSDYQHGFREKRSCVSQLLTTINDFARNLNDKKQTDSILLDFSKAFDKVNHFKLCLKVSHYGIRGTTLKWIKAFLSNRTQQVLLNGKSSDTANVLSGVPQGTVLGPLLFLIYINDMPSYVKSHIRLFADDAYLYRIIDRIDDPITLQEDLTALQQWETLWDMEFHPEKCKHLTITNKSKPIESSYSIHQTELEKVSNAKYLGVTLNNKLKWNTHIDTVCKKANQKRSFLQRNLWNCSRNIKAKAFNTYVRPILSYASPVWNPVSNQSLCDNLEMVQRKGARFVFSNWSWDASPTKMLNDLKWKSLEHQRKVDSIAVLHDIRSGKLAMQSILPKQVRDSIKYQPIHGRVIAYRDSFVPTTINWWNDLPKEILNIENRDDFKIKVSSYFDKN